MAVKENDLRMSDTAGAGRLSDVAYTRILESLFERRVPAGAFMSQSELVKLVDVPVAPLRDALRVLEGEGVVIIHPRSGIQFLKPGLELTRSTYQFRTIVERAAVRVFAEVGDEKVISSLVKEHEDLAKQIEANGLDSENMVALEATERLHNLIIASLTNPLIESAYRRMHHYLRLVRMERKLTPPLAQRSLKEHLDILYACEKRDPDTAEAAVQTHFTYALQRHMGMF